MNWNPNAFMTAPLETPLEEQMESLLQRAAKRAREYLDSHVDKMRRVYEWAGLEPNATPEVGRVADPPGKTWWL